MWYILAGFETALDVFERALHHVYNFSLQMSDERLYRHQHCTFSGGFLLLHQSYWNDSEFFALQCTSNWNPESFLQSWCFKVVKVVRLGTQGFLGFGRHETHANWHFLGKPKKAWWKGKN